LRARICAHLTLRCPLQVREIANNLTEEPFRWTAEALLALQEARAAASCAHACAHNAYVCSPVAQSMEDFMVKLFEDCNLCAIHAKRVTISAWRCCCACARLSCPSRADACARCLCALQCRRTCSWRGASAGPSTASQPSERARRRCCESDTRAAHACTYL
jgi:histone H3/H4